MRRVSLLFAEFSLQRILWSSFKLSEQGYCLRCTHRVIESMEQLGLKSIESFFYGAVFCEALCTNYCLLDTPKNEPVFCELSRVYHRAE